MSQNALIARFGADTEPFNKELSKASARVMAFGNDATKSIGKFRQGVELAGAALRGFGLIGIGVAVIQGIKQGSEALKDLADAIRKPDSALNDFIFKMKLATTFTQEGRDALREQRDAILESVKAEELYYQSLEESFKVQEQIDNAKMKARFANLSDEEKINELLKQQLEFKKQQLEFEGTDPLKAREAELKEVQAIAEIEKLRKKINDEITKSFINQYNETLKLKNQLDENIKAEQQGQEDLIKKVKFESMSDQEKIETLKKELQLMNDREQFLRAMAASTGDEVEQKKFLLEAEKARTAQLEIAQDGMMLEKKVADELAKTQEQSANKQKKLNEELHKQKMQQIEEAKKAEMDRIDAILNKEKERLQKEGLSKDDKRIMRTSQFGDAFRSQGMKGESREDFAMRKKLELLEQQAQEARLKAEGISTPASGAKPVAGQAGAPVDGLKQIPETQKAEQEKSDTMVSELQKINELLASLKGALS